MGRLIYSLNVSLDGYVEGPDRGLDWANVGDELARLREEFDGDMDVGGATMAASFIRRGLVVAARFCAVAAYAGGAGGSAGRGGFLDRRPNELRRYASTRSRARCKHRYDFAVFRFGPRRERAFEIVR